MNEIDLSRLVKSRLDRVVAIEYEEPGKAILFRRFADGDAAQCEVAERTAGRCQLRFLRLP